MKKRTLGRTGFKVSEIGYGAWGIGKTMWGPGTQDSESLRALARAVELGLNFFDTAYVYGDGHSERLIGRALAQTGVKDPVVASKVPPKNFQWPGRGNLRENFPPDWIVACTERSLKNLGLDALPLQQLHVWSDAWLADPAWDKTMAAIERLKKDGKILFWGVSINARAPRSALDLVESGLVDCVQVIFNLFEQEPANELFPLCKKNKVGVIARVPFDEGGLTGTLREDSFFEEEDFRRAYFAGPLLRETVRRAKALEGLLVKSGIRTLAEAALKFDLSFPEVSTVIAGMRKVSHVEENLAMAGASPYGRDELARLRAHAWKRNLIDP